MELTRANKIDLFDQYGRKLEGHCAIVDDNDHTRIFSVASDRYTLIQHEEACDSVTNALDEMGCKFKQIRTTDRGPTLFAEYDLPTVRHDVGGVGDIINLRIGVSNSYDCSSGLRTEIYGHRLVCSNGMFVSHILNKFYSRHIHGIDLDSIRENIVTGIAAFRNEFAGVIETYTKEYMDQRGALVFLDKCIEDKVIAKKYLESVKVLVEGDSGIERTPVQNKWGLYNRITEVLTHQTDDIFSQRRNIYKMEKLLSNYSMAA